MIQIRRGTERGHTSLPWLESHHSFSFGDYRDPRHMGFRSLRVINDDVVAPSAGFGEHPHRDMEILTFVQEGALEHRDSLGSGSVMRPGDVQLMSAGTGVAHSEMNASPDAPVRLLQVWIEPDRSGLQPGYQQRRFDAGWRLVASPDGRDDSLTIHQDAEIHRGSLEAGKSIAHPLAGRSGWLHVARGEVELHGHRLHEGDSAGIQDVDRTCFEAIHESDVLLFDLA